MKYLHLIVIALFLLSSCSEDPVSNNNGNNNGTPAVKPALVLKPDTLYSKTLTTFCFEARVDGFIHNDINLYWYFGEGDTVYQDKYNHGYACHSYNNPGTYTIFVKAVDAFADTVIDTKTTIAVISDVEKRVTISPSSRDTLMGTEITGRSYKVSFTHQTTLPESRVRAVWHISDGSSDTTTYGYNGLTYFFKQSGYHNVSVSIYDTNGSLWASDGTAIHITPQEVTDDLINKMNMVTVVFYSVPPVPPSPYDIRNFYGGISRSNPYTKTFLLGSSGINCSYSQPFLFDTVWRELGVEFHGSFSSDLTKIEDISMLLFDTSHVDTSNFNEAMITFPFKNIKLISVSKDVIVYGVYGLPVNDFLGTITYLNRGRGISGVGETYQSFGPLYDAYGKDNPPYLFVILSKGQY